MILLLSFAFNQTYNNNLFSLSYFAHLTKLLFILFYDVRPTYKSTCNQNYDSSLRLKMRQFSRNQKFTQSLII